MQNVHNSISVRAASLLALFTFYAIAYASPVARFTSDAERPNREWLKLFDTAFEVVAVRTIDEALARCPATQPCTVLIDQLHLQDSVYINRPNTKLQGIFGNKISKSLSAEANFFTIESNANNIAIVGLNLEGSNTLQAEQNGIVAYGKNINNLYIAENQIKQLRATDNAHAIAIYGTGENLATASTHIIIENNTIDTLLLGSSEAIAINGNVTNWAVRNNAISNINNIAIDAIGGEGTVVPTKSAQGRTLPNPWDSARNGFIEYNVISNVSTKSNAAYGNEESWAAAIYIDGANSIVVNNNTIQNVPWAIEVGAENCIVASHVSIDKNTIGKTLYGDILLGGYRKNGFIEHSNINCDPYSSSDNSEGHGYVEHIKLNNNRFVSDSLNQSNSNARCMKAEIQFRTTHIEGLP